MPSIQQRVMHYAHELYNNVIVFPTKPAGERWKECLEQAWELHYLRYLLAHGVVEFTYLKRDGTMRTARGTNYLDIIPPSKQPNGHQQLMIDAGMEQPNYKSIAYYDLDKEDWRAFKVINFVQINRMTAITPIE